MRPDTEVLRRLYLDERKTTYEIGAIYGVNRVSVGRWLRLYGIPIRSGGDGLANREIEPPSAETLTRLVHVEHQSYAQIGAAYGVTESAVMHWLKRHGIKRPTIWGTRYGANAPAIPPLEELVTLYESGLSLDDIGDRFGVSAMPIRARFRSAGITVKPGGWDGGKRFACADGHSVRSTYEQRIDNWLSEHGVTHIYEPPLPWDWRGHADFIANGWYIEIWGVTGSQRYADRRARKQAGYRTHGIPLVEIHHDEFHSRERRRLMRKLTRVADGPPPLPLL